MSGTAGPFPVKLDMDELVREVLVALGVKKGDRLIVLRGGQQQGYETRQFDFIGMNPHDNRGFVATADGLMFGFNGETGDCLRRLPALPGLLGSGLLRPQVAEDGSFGTVANHFYVCDYGSDCHPAIPLYYIVGL